MHEALLKLLAQLNFKGMAASLERLLAQADAEALPPAEVVLRLLEEEWRYRQKRRLASRLDAAKLPWDWSLATFPFARQPGVNAAPIKGLAGLGFLPRAENLVFIGPPGTGKSGLAVALLREALLNGYRARFYKAQELFDELYASLADRSTSRLLKRLARYDVLVIDELGYLILKPEQVNAFFKLMDLHYAGKPSIITTNLDYPHWYELFQRKPVVDALLDRLHHHPHRRPLAARPRQRSRSALRETRPQALHQQALDAAIPTDCSPSPPPSRHSPDHRSLPANHSLPASLRSTSDCADRGSALMSISGAVFLSGEGWGTGLSSRSGAGAAHAAAAA